MNENIPNENVNPWQPRPSGAWSRPYGDEGGSAGGSAAGVPPAGDAPAGGFPAHNYPAGMTPPAPSQWPRPFDQGGAYGVAPQYGIEAGAGAGSGGGGAVQDGSPAGSGDSAAPRTSKHGAKSVLVTVAVAALALAAGFGGGLLSGSMSAGSTATSDTPLVQHTGGQNTSASVQSAGDGSVQDVAATVLPSVVSVVSLSSQAEGEGSGIVLTSSGLILTNNHVIDGAQTLTVQFNDGTVASASVVGTDPTDDLAVIKVSGVSGLTPAVLGRSADVQVGEQVVAVGSPLGLSATVTTGIVSAINRPVRTESAQSAQSQGTVLNAIQTDASINPGNSGGPLVDMKGRVIGINSAIASLSQSLDGQAGSIGVGFAIPIDQAYRVAQEIIDTGQASHAVLGANVTDHVDRSRGITTGAEIASVVDGSGAQKAGLDAGDVVTRVDSVPIESADALIATIRAAEPGGQVQLTYLRGGQSHTVTVTLGSSSK